MMIIHVMDVSMTSELLRISLYIGAISGVLRKTGEKGTPLSY